MGLFSDYADRQPDVPGALQRLVGEVHNAMDSLKNAQAAKNSETLRRVQSFLTDLEEKSAAYQRSVEAAERRRHETTERIDAVDRHTKSINKRLDDLAIRLQSSGIQAATTETKTFFKWLAGADTRDLDVKTLRTDGETQGGYLIPQIMDNAIRKNITEISPVRRLARVRTAAGKTIEVPRRLALLSASYEGETEVGSADQSIYGSESVTLYRQTVTVPATLDLMVSSQFDLEREIAIDVAEAFAKSESAAFVNGAGAKGPQGFVQDSRVEIMNTAGTGVITFDDIANLAAKLKHGYRGAFLLNRRTLSTIQSLSSSIGVPIWQPIAGRTPATIFGWPYTSDFIDLDDASTGSGAKPIVFADLRAGYEVFDMVGISVIRDDVTRKKEAITEWTFRRYGTGRVILPEAIKIMKIL